MAHLPFAVDITTDETLKTGIITIVADTQGDSDALRQLRDELCRNRSDIYQRGDTKTHVPETPTEA